MCVFGDPISARRVMVLVGCFCICEAGGSWCKDVGSGYHLGMFKGGPIGVLVVVEMGRGVLGVERCMRGIDCDMIGIVRRDVVWMRPAAGLHDRIVVAIVSVARAVEYAVFLYTPKCRRVPERWRGVAYEFPRCVEVLDTKV